MEITDFLSSNFLATFTGSLFAIELIVFSTKNLPLIKLIPTKVYTFIMTVSHLIIVNTINNTLKVNIEYFYGLFINSLVITVMLCGGYDFVIGNISINKSTNTNTNNIEFSSSNTISSNNIENKVNENKATDDTTSTG